MCAQQITRHEALGRPARQCKLGCSKKRLRGAKRRVACEVIDQGTHACRQAAVLWEQGCDNIGRYSVLSEKFDQLTRLECAGNSICGTAGDRNAGARKLCRCRRCVGSKTPMHLDGGSLPSVSNRQTVGSVILSSRMHSCVASADGCDGMPM